MKSFLLATIAASVTFVSLPAMTIAAPDEGVNAAYTAAYTLYKAGKVEAAIAAYERVIAESKQKNDRSTESYATLGLGTLYRETQQTQKAIALLKTSAQLVGHQPELQMQKLTAIFGLGRAYADLGDNREALAAYQEALALSERLGDTLTRNGILNNLGSLYLVQGNYTEAKTVLTQAIAVSKQTQQAYQAPITLNNFKTYCDRAKNNASNMFDQFLKQFCESGLKPDQLIPNFENLRMSVFEQARNLEMNSLNNLGLVASHRGNYPEALQYHEKSRNLSQAIGKKDGVATSLNNLANIYTAIGDYPKALQLFNETRGINEAMNDRFQLGRTLSNIGYVYSQQGDFRKGLELYRQSFDLAKQTGDKEQLATVQNNIATNYQYLSEFPAATAAYDEALKLHQATGSRSGIAITTANLGVFYSTIGDFPKADRNLNDALQQVQAIGSPNLVATTYANLAQLYSDQGQYAKAIDFYGQSLDIHRKLGDRAQESSTLLSMGSTYRALGKPAKAQAHCQQALAQTRSIGAKALEAMSLVCLGNVAIEQSQYAQSKTLLDQALTAHRAIGNRRSEISTLKALGRLALDQKQFQPAIDPLAQGLQLAQSLGLKLEESELLTLLGKTQLQLNQRDAAQQNLQAAIQVADPIGNKPTAAEAKTLLGELWIQTQQFGQAQPLLMQAIETWESLRPGLTDSDRVSLFDLQRKTYALQQQVLVGQNQTDAALVMSERGRARAFIELIASQAKTPQNTLPSLAEIKAIAQAQQATLVQYSTVSERLLYVWVIQPNGTLNFTQIPLTESIAQMVRESREIMGVRSRAGITIAGENLSDERAIKASLWELHQILIEPIAADLPKNPDDRVIILPQDDLFLVPFPALTDAQDRPLIERHTLTSAPSIQALGLTHTLKRPARLPVPLIVGNPKMPLYQGKPLEALPGSEREAQKIADLLNTRPLLGAQATKPTVLAQIPQATHIHLATHGILDTLRGEVPGAIALTATTGNDGFLTASEIMDLKLSADLVVLSACSTGDGDLTGDGVVGLSRSLFLAGVPSVVVSLWNVGDDSTAALMTEFYKNLTQRKLDKAQALRQAMLTTRKQYPKPADWAAFNLVGEGL